MQVRPIGVIHTPFCSASGTPIQPSAAKGTVGTIEIFDRYQEGLNDLEGFERIWLIYWFHKAAKHKIKVVPYLDDQERGLFSTRAPSRPNPLGISAVRLLKIDGNILTIGDVDILTGTPLLDIKPYVPQFDCFRVRRCGWVGRMSSDSVVADDRFEKAAGKTGGKGSKSRRW